MSTQIHTIALDLNFKLLNQISTIDRFYGEWLSIVEGQDVQTMNDLRTTALLESTGASNRIENVAITDDEVRAFIYERKQGKLKKRDQQNLAGFFRALENVLNGHQDIDISEMSLKAIHNELMSASETDEWHKGDYKQYSNSVQVTHANGHKSIVFEPTPPGVETEEAMNSLIKWYNNDNQTPPLIKLSIFVYDFLSIHPFQDGNGRMSRLICTLLLLKHGYSWIEYVSFDQEIEKRKAEYYRVLMDCQSNRPGENITPWLHFFFNCTISVQEKLKNKLKLQKRESHMSPREKKIYAFVGTHPGCSSGDIADKLNIPLPTVKRILADMVTGQFLAKHGIGAGTNYTTEYVMRTESDIAVLFTSERLVNDFMFHDKYDSMILKKIILTPKFEWKKPDDWATVLIQQTLQLKVVCHDSKGGTISQVYSIGTFNTPYHFQPVFTIPRPIQLPLGVDGRDRFDNDYPIRVEIELLYRQEELKFDVMLVYDSSF